MCFYPGCNDFAFYKAWPHKTNPFGYPHNFFGNGVRRAGRAPGIRYKPFFINYKEQLTRYLLHRIERIPQVPLKESFEAIIIIGVIEHYRIAPDGSTHGKLNGNSI